jgi:hypothetical protein
MRSAIALRLATVETVREPQTRSRAEALRCRQTIANNSPRRSEPGVHLRRSVFALPRTSVTGCAAATPIFDAPGAAA